MIIGAICMNCRKPLAPGQWCDACWPQKPIVVGETRDPVQQVLALCRRYDSPQVNPGAHALARKVRKLLGDPTISESA